MEVIWTPKALKQLMKLKDRKTQQRILLAARALADFPEVSGVKALHNHQYDYRLRVGDYRVWFNALPTAGLINIEEVKKRDERTY